MKQRYYEAVITGLVPVTNVREDTSGWFRSGGVVATVKEDTGAYKAGEEITFLKWHLVEKVRYNRDGFLMVRTVPVTEQ